MNFYAFHIGDYASDTRHLTWLEDIAYRRLIDLYYIREEALPLDMRQIYRLVVASTEEQREAVETVVFEFFEKTEHGFVHSRCESEISAANDKKNKASQSAQKRWSNAKTENTALPTESERNANAMRTHENENANASKTQCEGNAPNPNPNPNISKPRALSLAGFDDFWNSYPSKVGKGAAEASWKKLRPPLAECLAAIESARKSKKWIEGYIPNPSTWLNQRRWEDEVSQLCVVENNEPDLVTTSNGQTVPRDFLRRIGASA